MENSVLTVTPLVLNAEDPPMLSAMPVINPPFYRTENTAKQLAMKVTGPPILESVLSVSRLVIPATEEILINVFLVK
jgi:hypothetical protein